MYFYLGQGGRKAVLEGQKRMTTRVKAAVEAAGWTVEMRPAEERDLIPGRTGFHLVLNEEVPADHCLTLRRVGWEPFWRIEFSIMPLNKGKQEIREAFSLKDRVSYFDGFSTIKICKVEECDEDILCLKC